MQIRTVPAPLPGPEPTTPNTDELTSLRREVASLRARVASLEAERDEYAQQNAELFVLQQVFSTINSTLEIDDILGVVLRGIFETMGFRRVLLFEVREAAAIRRLETGPEGAVVPSPDPGALRRTGSLQAILAGTLELAVGHREDGESPLEDAAGAYCMLPLTGADQVRGVLYVDDAPTHEINDSQVRMLLDFAAQAAIALENARLHAETRRLLEETQRLAASDPLTGLANRRALSELMERELHNAARYSVNAALLLFDLDDLKQINDSGGHLAGDEALKAFAQALKSESRRGDAVARFGGDEFVIFMPQGNHAGAEAAVERLYRAFRTRGLRCSVGIAIFPRDGTRAEDLFNAADRALYAAKQAGKNRFRFASEPG